MFLILTETRSTNAVHTNIAWELFDWNYKASRKKIFLKYKMKLKKSLLEDLLF